MSTWTDLNLGTVVVLVALQFGLVGLHQIKDLVQRTQAMDEEQLRCDRCTANSSTASAASCPRYGHC